MRNPPKSKKTRKTACPALPVPETAARTAEAELPQACPKISTNRNTRMPAANMLREALRVRLKPWRRPTGRPIKMVPPARKASRRSREKFIQNLQKAFKDDIENHFQCLGKR